MRNTGILTIQLKSDLCTGSGTSYARVIDSDICYDEYGLPYIPARRIKGCLREAGRMIGLDDGEVLDTLFGKGGQNQVNEPVEGIYIENARVEGYDELCSSLQNLRQDKGYAAVITPQKVLSCYTGIKSQTKIEENGVAKDNSLRMIRTINHYAPMSDNSEASEMKFVATMSCETDQWANLEKCVKALRNMGMNRNRGLGSVKCTLKADESANKNRSARIDGTIKDDSRKYRITYTVRNTAPLMLSSINDNATEQYISGVNVIGFLAGAYLRDNHIADTAFEELFLSGDVTYSALYPTEGDLICYPAPDYLKRLKRSGKYVNATFMSLGDVDSLAKDGKSEESKVSPYNATNGNQPKSLQGKFVGRADGGSGNDTYYVKEIVTDLVFHHSHENEREKKDEQLYTLEAVRENQLFSGTITGKGSALKKLLPYLEQGTLRFGKSKGAQYGTCKLVSGSVREYVPKQLHLSKGDRLLVVLQSDAIFLNDCGYTVDYQQIRELIQVQLQEELQMKVQSSDKAYGSIQVKELTGYYSKWNLKRPACPAIGAGSTFEYEVKGDCTVNPQLYVGERWAEGYGLAEICIDKPYQKASGEEDAPEYAVSFSKVKAAVVGHNNHAADVICRKILLEEAREQLRLAALDAKKKNLGITASALGRVTLMLKESLYDAQYKEPKALKCNDKVFSLFYEKVKSIKTNNPLEEIESLLYIRKAEGIYCMELIDKVMNEQAELGSLAELYNCLSDGKKLEDELKKYWSEYLMTILVQEKYRMKQTERPEGGENNE